jgi:hypothetical protein
MAVPLVQNVSRYYTKSCKNVQRCEMVAHCTLKIEGIPMAVCKKIAPHLAKNPAADKGGDVPLITSISIYDAFTTKVREDLRVLTHTIHAILHCLARC